MYAWTINIQAIIKEASKRDGVKLGRLAERCGYSPSRFSQLANGHKNVTALDVMKICAGMNVTPNEIFGHSGEGVRS